MDYTGSGTGVPYVQFEGVFYMPTRACSREYKLWSRDGECPFSVEVSYECSMCEWSRDL
jgi:hypothetical protein